MGTELLNNIELLRTASELGCSAIVDDVDTGDGTTMKLVGIGPIILTKELFIMYWSWVMTGSKVYYKLFNSNSEFRNTVDLLNPKLPKNDKLEHVDYVLRVMYKKIDIDEKYEIFRRVIEEFN